MGFRRALIQHEIPKVVLPAVVAKLFAEFSSVDHYRRIDCTMEM